MRPLEGQGNFEDTLVFRISNENMQNSLGLSTQNLGILSGNLVSCVAVQVMLDCSRNV